MSLKVKYHYTHFIHPFTIKSDRYYSFLKKVLKDERNWKLHIDRQEANFDSYNFFLPYMKKFLFPTLFWNNKDIKEFKKKTPLRKAMALEKVSCITFKYNLNSMRNGSLSKTRYGVIDFDIVSIELICFSSGICFLDFKTEIYDSKDYIDFDKVLDFNHIFRDITNKTDDKIRAKCEDCVDDIATFIKKLTGGYASEEIEKQYYNKLFTYSYVCTDKESWKGREDYPNVINDFLRFQYVEKGSKRSIFNPDSERIRRNIYSRWEHSLFGFSRESGVVMGTDVEKYNYTELPYSFERKYYYILILALYQRISLINFSHELLKNDKTQVNKLQRKFTKFTHFSWFSEISNSEHGMELWKKWKEAFELDELFEEVHKEYMEYYEYVAGIRQERINFILIIIYIIAAIFSGIALLSTYFDVSGFLTPKIVIALIGVLALSYPVFLVITWFKHKTERK